MDALAQLARHYGVGARKYDDNQWRKGYEFSKSYAALNRHLQAWWGGENLDEETGSSHLAAVAWHAFTLMTFQKYNPEFDDRFIAKEPATTIEKWGFTITVPFEHPDYALLVGQDPIWAVNTKGEVTREGR